MILVSKRTKQICLVLLLIVAGYCLLSLGVVQISSAEEQSHQSMENSENDFDEKVESLSKWMDYLEDQMDAEVTRQENLALEKAQSSEIVSRSMPRSKSGMNLTSPSNATAEDINRALEGTGLAGLGHAFEKAEKDHGVNALFLVAVAVIESGWGNSQLARERNNLFGWQAYDHNVNAARWFDSKEECIDIVAKSIKRSYLTKGGAFHRGFTAKDVNIMYSSDPKWHEKVTQIMQSLSRQMSP